MKKVKRLLASPAALELIHALKEKHGELIFHQSGGCCDGSSPICFEKNDFKTGESDVGVGYIDDCPFYMSKDQFEYWQYTELTLDVVKGRGSSFSIEIPTGYRFITRSRLFGKEEFKDLEDTF